MDKKIYNDLKEQFREITLIDIDDYDLLFSNRIDRLEESSHISLSVSSLRQDRNKQKEEMGFMFNNIVSTKERKDATYKLLQFDDTIIIKFICESKDGLFYINEYILKKIDRKEKFKELTGIDLSCYKINDDIIRKIPDSKKESFTWHSMEWLIDYVIGGGDFDILIQKDNAGLNNYILSLIETVDDKNIIQQYSFKCDIEKFQKLTSIDLNKYKLVKIERIGENSFIFEDEPIGDNSLKDIIKLINSGTVFSVSANLEKDIDQYITYSLSLYNKNDNLSYCYKFGHIK